MIAVTFPEALENRLTGEVQDRGARQDETLFQEQVMLTPERRALFAAAYSALLLHSERDEADHPPVSTSAGDRPNSKLPNSSPTTEQAGPTGGVPVTEVIAEPDAKE